MKKEPDNPISHATLREIIGEIPPLAMNKELSRLDKHCRHFISLSPFVCLGTMSANGKADVSPRGDPPGFVKVIDDTTLLLPDRPGNRRVDSMNNIIENSSIGMMFFVPGIEEVLRVNGKAEITCDQTLLAELAIRNIAPKLGLLIKINTVFFHCAKAIKRSGLWDPDAQIPRSAFPSYGEIIHDQRIPSVSAEELESRVQTNYKEELY